MIEFVSDKIRKEDDLIEILILTKFNSKGNEAITVYIIK